MNDLTEMAVFLSKHLTNHSVYVNLAPNREFVDFHFIEVVSATEAIYGVSMEKLYEWDQSNELDDQLKAIAMEIEHRMREYNAAK